MNFYNFFNPDDYEYIKTCIDNQIDFMIKRKYKEQVIDFKGWDISGQDLGNIWKGNYLVGVNESYKTSGGGYATEDFSLFKDFESFKNLVDDTLSKRAGYIKDNQLSLF